MWGCLQYASLLGCRFMDATGNGWVSDAIRCWEYCMSKDTPVLSNSWGGVDYSQALQVRPALASLAPYEQIDKVGWPQVSRLV